MKLIIMTSNQRYTLLHATPSWRSFSDLLIKLPPPTPSPPPPPSRLYNVSSHSFTSSSSSLTSTTTQPLMFAAHEGHANVLKVLIEFGANVDQVSVRMEEEEGGGLEGAGGGGINQKRRGGTKTKRKKISKRLSYPPNCAPEPVTLSAFNRQEDRSGTTAMHRAAQMGHTHIVTELYLNVIPKPYTIHPVTLHTRCWCLVFIVGGALFN